MHTVSQFRARSPLFCWIWLPAQSKATLGVAEGCSPPPGPPCTTRKVQKLCGFPADPKSQSQRHALARSLLVACGQNVMENKTCRGVLAGGLQLALYLLCARQLLWVVLVHNGKIMAAETGPFSPNNCVVFFFKSVKTIQTNSAWLNRACFLSSEGQHTVLKSHWLSNTWKIDGVSRCWEEMMQRSTDYLINI